MGNAYRSVLAGGGAGTPITPSNSSPVSMTSGETYTPTTNGVAVESVTNLTPANSSPPSISTGNIYKPTTSGKAIASIATNGSSVTPSSSGKYFYAGWNKMESSGYAYSSRPTMLDVDPGYYVSVGGSTGQMPYSNSSAGFIALMIGTKGYSTLTTTQPNRVWISGIKSDGSIVNLKTQGTATTVDISDYDYVWFSFSSASNLSLTVSIS